MSLGKSLFLGSLVVAALVLLSRRDPPSPDRPGSGRGTPQVAAASPPLPLAPPPEHFKPRTLSDKERAALNFMLAEDALGFARGQKSLLGETLMRASSADVATVYQRNEVAGDKRYEGKRMLVTARVVHIHSGLGDKPVLTLDGGGYFSGPEATFMGDPSERVAKLSAGEPIYLVCVGGGVVAGTALFKECEFSDDYARRANIERHHQMSIALSGEQSFAETTASLLFAALATTQFLPDDAACLAEFSQEPGLAPDGSGLTKVSKACLAEMRTAATRVTADRASMARVMKMPAVADFMSDPAIKKLMSAQP